MAERYIRATEEEVSTIENAMAADFGEPSRISKGGYLHLLAKRRLEELDETEVPA